MQAQRFTHALAALAALYLSLSFSSCKKKDSDPSPTNPAFDVQVDKTSATREIDTIKVNVLTNFGWSLSSDQPWLKPITGTGSGNAVIKVAVDYNVDGPSRAGNITVTTIGGAYTKTINITQAGAKLYLLAAKDTVANTGEAIQVQVFAQGTWNLKQEMFFAGDVSPRPDNPASLSRSSGSGNATVTLTVPKNYRDTRFFVLTLSNGTDPEYTLPITQLQALSATYLTGVTLGDQSSGLASFFSTADNRSYGVDDAPSHGASIDLTVATIRSQLILLSYVARDTAAGLTTPVPTDAATCHYFKTNLDGQSLGKDGYFPKSAFDSVQVSLSDPQSVHIQKNDVIGFRNQDGKKGIIRVEDVNWFGVVLNIWME